MLVTFVVFASLLVLSLLVLLWYFLPRGRQDTTVPGLAPTHETLGNLPNIADAGSLPKFLSSLHCEHGSIASFWHGEYLTISLGSFHLFKQVEKLFPASPCLYQSLVPVVSDPWILAQEGEHGRFFHRVLSQLQPFKHSGDGMKVQVIQLSKELCSVWKSVPNDDQIPVLDYMTALAVKIVSTCQLGSYFQEEKHVASFIQAYNNVMIDVELKMLEDVHWEQNDPRELAFRGKIDKFKMLIKESIKHHNSQANTCDVRAPFLQQILENSNRDTDLVVADIMAFAITEITTIGCLLTWLLYYLSIHPEVQSRTRSELKAGRLVYIRQVLREVMRITHFVPFVSRVQHQRDVAIAGHIIEPGTLVLLSLSTAARDPKVYPEPDQFEPDRFSPDMANTEVVESIFNPREIEDMSSEVILGALSVILPLFDIQLADKMFRCGVKCSPFSKPDADIWINLTKL